MQFTHLGRGLFAAAALTKGIAASAKGAAGLTIFVNLTPVKLAAPLLDHRGIAAALARPREAQGPVERIDGERFAGFFTGDEIVIVAPRVVGPKSLDDHDHEYAKAATAA